MNFKHLRKTGYSYPRHFLVSMKWAARMAKLSCCAVCHAVWPDVFTDTVTESIKKYAKDCNKTQKK